MLGPPSSHRFDFKFRGARLSQLGNMDLAILTQPGVRSGPSHISATVNGVSVFY